MPSFAFAEPDATIEPTPVATLDALVERLNDAKKSWVDTPVAERRALLHSLVERTQQFMDRWADAETRAKGLDPSGAEINEAYQNIFASMRGLEAMDNTLDALARTGSPPRPAGGFSERPDGRLVAHTMPMTAWDRLLFPGISGEVWLEPGVSRHNLSEHQAIEYRRPSHPEGRVCLVLGAGNQSSIAFLDALYALYAENCVVLLKMNPVNEYMGPILRDIWQPFVDRGWFDVVYGGAEVGKHLTSHAGVAKIHITGSDATHDAIIWGPSEGRAARKAAGEPVLDKEISSELGNVTPILIPPAPWTPAEITYQAHNVASMLTHNASFNCLAAKVLVTSADWPQRDAFLSALKERLSTIGTRLAYYPGAKDRWTQFRDAHPHASVLGEPEDGHLPWLLIPGVDPSDEEQIAFKREAWCGVLAETALPGKTPEVWFPRAVRLCNDVLWGTLACGILVHPSITKRASGKAALESALDDLRYGSIALNLNPSLGYGLQTLPWGAHPGHTLEDIGSGRGKVHNSLLFDPVQKGVVRGPWKFMGKPPWYPDHRTAHKLWPRLVRFQASHSPFKLPGIFAAFLRG